MMDVKILAPLIIIFITPLLIVARRTDLENRRPTSDAVKNIHHIHAKRHMTQNENEPRRRTSTLRPRDIRKKPSGHLKPLEEDDIENDEVVSVAIGPPAIRPKFDKPVWKQSPRSVINGTNNTASTRLVKEVLIQLGREFLTHQVSEDFVFGQYIGNAMRNLKSDLRLRMQHEILDLVVRYQKLNRGDTLKPEEQNIPEDRIVVLKEGKIDKKSTCSNDTEESWSDFPNFAKIVG